MLINIPGSQMTMSNFSQMTKGSFPQLTMSNLSIMWESPISFGWSLVIPRISNLINQPAFGGPAAPPALFPLQQQRQPQAEDDGEHVFALRQMAMGKKPVPPANIPIPTKID